jgi:hypothetical protein
MPVRPGASLNAALAEIAAARMRASEYETSDLDRAAAEIAAEYPNMCCPCRSVSCRMHFPQCCP